MVTAGAFMRAGLQIAHLQPLQSEPAFRKTPSGILHCKMTGRLFGGNQISDKLDWPI
jgi:hypothetical protein